MQKEGLNCTQFCRHCNGQTCDNLSVIHLEIGDLRTSRITKLQLGFTRK